MARIAVFAIVDITSIMSSPINNFQIVFFFFIFSACTKCNDECTLCSSATICSECIADYTLENKFFNYNFSNSILVNAFVILQKLPNAPNALIQLLALSVSSAGQLIPAIPLMQESTIFVFF